MKNIFISSTFVDFQKERDILNKVVLPQINRNVKETGAYISFQDLRWGIDTSDMDESTSNLKVMKICLDEVEKSLPYFVVFLGDRYGYVPNEADIKKEANRHGLYLDDYNMSMTELEIQYAINIIKNNDKHVLFYFRNINGEYPNRFLDDNPKHKTMLDNLKSRIRREYPKRIKEYSVSFGEKMTEDYLSFASMLYNDIMSLIEEDVNSIKIMDSFTKKQLQAKYYFTYKEKGFLAHNDFKNYIKSQIELNLDNVYLILGESGLGKTTVLSKVLSEIEDKYDYTLYFECGYTVDSLNARGIMKSIINFLHQHYGVKEQGDKRLDIAYRDCLKEFDKLNKKLLITIDGINQLSAGYYENNYLFLLRGLKNVTFLCSHTKDEYNCFYGTKFEMPVLDLEAKKEIIAAQLIRLGKELNEKVINHILVNSKTNNPLYFQLTIAFISLYDEKDFEKINADYNGDFIRAQIETIDNMPSNLENLIVAFLEKLANNNRFLLYAFLLLGLSRDGLRLEEIEAIVDIIDVKLVDKNDFYIAIDYIPQLFISKEDGKYDYSHIAFRNAYAILEKPEIKGSFYRIIYDILGKRGIEITYGYYYAYNGHLLNEIFYNMSRQMDIYAIRTFVDVLRIDKGEILQMLSDNYQIEGYEKVVPMLFKGVSKFSIAFYECISSDGDELDFGIKIAMALVKIYGSLFDILLKTTNNIDDYLFDMNNNVKMFSTPYDEMLNFYQHKKTEAGYSNAVEACKKAIEYRTIISQKLGYKLTTRDEYFLQELNYLNEMLGVQNQKRFENETFDFSKKILKIKDVEQLHIISLKYSEKGRQLLAQNGTQVTEEIIKFNGTQVTEEIIKFFEYSNKCRIRIYELNRSYQIGLYLLKNVVSLLEIYSAFSFKKYRKKIKTNIEFFKKVSDEISANYGDKETAFLRIDYLKVCYIYYRDNLEDKNAIDCLLEYMIFSLEYSIKYSELENFKYALGTLYSSYKSTPCDPNLDLLKVFEDKINNNKNVLFANEYICNALLTIRFNKVLPPETLKMMDRICDNIKKINNN